MNNYNLKRTYHCPKQRLQQRVEKLPGSLVHIGRQLHNSDIDADRASNHHASTPTLTSGTQNHSDAGQTSYAPAECVPWPQFRRLYPHLGPI